MFDEGFMRDFFSMPSKRKSLTEDDIRRIVREELKLARKVGCSHFQMRDAKGYCRNCGYHRDEHLC